jgi:flagellar protein FlgJ
MLAQAALESGWGQHEIKAQDGSTSHNLFGIKAGSSWEGQAVNATTTEYRQGLATRVSAKFRAYADYAEAFIDYAKLLKQRYRGVVEAGNDAQAFVRGIVSGGYATDPAYGFKLEGTIRRVASVGT